MDTKCGKDNYMKLETDNSVEQSENGVKRTHLSLEEKENSDEKTDDNLQKKSRTDNTKDDSTIKSTEKMDTEERLNNNFNEDANETDWTKKTLQQMTERDWRHFKYQFKIAVRGGSIPNPIRYWKEASISSHILQTLQTANCKEPTEIQRQAIPIGLEGRDMIGIARCGSGKTIAYAIPLIEYISRLPKLDPQTAMDGPYAIVLLPTRELAWNIQQEIQRFADPFGIRTCFLTGGVGMEEQHETIRKKGCEILVATPGRLLDFIERRYISLKQCSYVVIDEADRLLDVGFGDYVINILKSIPSTREITKTEEAINPEYMNGRRRITNIFTSTLPTSLEQFAKKILHNPAVVTVGNYESFDSSFPQNIIWTTPQEKQNKLLQLLENNPPSSTVVYANAKRTCDQLARLLSNNGYKTGSIHAGKLQNERVTTLEDFRLAKFNILVITDVQSRGMDLNRVDHIINYDMSRNIDSYVFRIGRTGVAPRRTPVTTFLTNEDSEVFNDLKKLLESTGNQVPHELLMRSTA